MYGLGISGVGDKVLGDCVRAGVVTDERIDGATGECCDAFQHSIYLCVCVCVRESE